MKLSPTSMGFCVTPGAPSDHGVPCILEKISATEYCITAALLKCLHQAVPMNAGVERHSVVHPDLGTFSGRGQSVKCIQTDTSISSSSSQTKVGPGNCPFILITSRGCPFGAPISHVKVNSCFRCFAQTSVTRRKTNRTKALKVKLIFAK